MEVSFATMAEIFNLIIQSCIIVVKLARYLIGNLGIRLQLQIWLRFQMKEPVRVFMIFKSITAAFSRHIQKRRSLVEITMPCMQAWKTLWDRNKCWMKC